MLTITSCLREGINAFLRRFPLLMGAWILILGAQQLVDLLIPDVYALAEVPIYVALVAPLYAGQYLLSYKVVRCETATFRDLFRGFRHWGTLIGVSLVTSIIVVVGMLLLVIPGIVWALMFAFAPIVVLDPWTPDGIPRRAGVFDALGTSKDLTKGYKATLFGVAFVLGLPTIAISVLLTLKAYNPTFPVSLWMLELLALLSGALFVGPIASTSYMVAYDRITRLGRSTYGSLAGDEEPSGAVDS
jgi:uncharacterized membrane protein